MTKNKIYKGLLILIFMFLIIFTILISMTSYGKKKESENNTNDKLFETVQGDGIVLYRIVYNKQTRVMYAVSSYGEFIVLVNRNGTPMIWEKD